MTDHKLSARVWTNRGIDYAWAERESAAVPGGWKVQILWHYLDRIPTWESQLARPIRKAIDKGNSSWWPRGPFKDFHYKTMGQNLLELVELTPAQVNLIADLSCWSVTESEDAFRDALA